MTLFSIRTKVPLATSVPLIFCVALIGWVAFYNARKTVDGLSLEISKVVGEQVEGRLNDYLEIPQLISETNIRAVQLGDLNIQDRQGMEKHFWRQMKVFKNVGGIQFGIQQNGAGVGVVRALDQSLSISAAEGNGAPQIYYATEAKGTRGKELNRIPNYDTRERPWFKTAVQDRKPTWTQPNPKSGTNKLRLSSVHPLYNEATGQLLGVFSVDLYLSQISDFLKSLNASQSGKVFIVDRSGVLVATSTDETLFLQKGKQTQRLKATDSKDTLIQAAAQEIHIQFQGFGKVETTQSFRFVQKGEIYLGYINRFTQTAGLDWDIVVVVPEKQFMKGVEQTTQITVFIGGGVLLLGLLIGITASRWLVNPLLRLNAAADQLKAGKFDPETIASETSRSDEIGQLARVFGEMAVVVQSREQSLQEQVQHFKDETNKAKEAATALQSGNGMINPHLLLQQSRQIRLQVESRQQNLPELLQTVSYFQSFTQAELHRLIGLGYERRLAADEFICREGEPGDAFCIILAGSVDVYLETLNKKIAVRSTGDFLGELSLLLGIPRTATVRTLEPTTLFVVDQKSFQLLLRDYPNLGEQVAQKLNERQFELQQRKEDLRKHGLLGDEATFSGNFLAWARQRLKTLFGSPVLVKVERR